MLCEALSCDQAQRWRNGGAEQVKGCKVGWTERTKKGARHCKLETRQLKNCAACHIVLTEIKMEVSVSSLGDLTMLDGYVTCSVGWR